MRTIAMRARRRTSRSAGLTTLLNAGCGNATCSWYRLVVLLLAASAGWSLIATPARAGIGPENTAVIVNKRSWSSRTIANHYVSLRRIPPNNVIYIDWNDSDVKTDIKTFREKLLKPVLDATKKRGVAEQIDCIAWSSGFPYEIDFSKETKMGGTYRSGSLTGLTYLYQIVLSGQTDKLPINNTNRYANTTAAPNSSRGFRHRYNWTDISAAPGTDLGQRYILSTVLGYTSGKGNSVEQVVDYLRRSALADGTHPDGTVYFMTNADVRTTTRSGHFQRTINAIRKEGGRAVIEKGMSPVAKPDVIGAMTGHSAVRWNTQSKMLPGAICENLTSFGGVMAHSSPQTALSEFLKYGAAGTSGTVIEPFSVIGKFPHPVLHLHYRRGCTLAESFYASVAAPYQLLVVGDPLCRPYANIPTVTVEGLESTSSLDELPVLEGEVRLRPTITGKSDQTADKFELYVGGRLRQAIRPGGEFAFDSTKMPDGYHEMRIVAVMNDRVETLGRWIKEVIVANRDRQVVTDVKSPARLLANNKFIMDIETPDSNRLLIMQNQNLIGNVNSGKESISLTAKSLGYGPVKLAVVGLGVKPTDNIFARPVAFEVLPGPLFRARPSAIASTLADGLSLTRHDGKRVSVPSTAPADWLAKAGVKPGKRFSLSGTMNAPRTSIYTLQVASSGGIQMMLDGMPLAKIGVKLSTSHYELPLLLEKGTHRLRVTGRVGKDLKLSIALGDQGTKPLMGPTFQHIP